MVTKKIPAKKDSRKKIKISSEILTTFGGELSDGIEKYINAGWEMVGMPILSHFRTPHLMNPTVVGKHPHFLVLFRKG